MESLIKQLDQLRLELAQAEAEKDDLLTQLRSFTERPPTRTSIINYSNFDSVHRQNFTKLRKEQNKLLKQEEVRLNETVSSQKEQIEALQQVQLIIEQLQKEAKGMEEYKQQLKAVDAALHKQISETIEKKNYMYLEIGIINNQTYLEKKLSQLNVKFDYAQLESLNKDLNMVQFKKDEPSSKTLAKDSLLLKQINDKQVDFDVRFQKLQSDFEEQIAIIRQKKESQQKEINEMRQKLANSDDLDPILKTMQQRNAEDLDRIEKLQVQEGNLDFEIKAQEDNIHILEQKIQNLKK